MTDVTIRKMREEDRPRVLDILAYWNMTPREPTPELPDPESHGMGPDSPAFVAVEGDRIVGVGSYILHGGRRAETASLAVDPAWLGKGVGEFLQIARLTEMKSLGVEVVKTETDRPDVIEWYQRKFGYRIKGKNPKKHDFCLSDVDHWTVLELDLRGWSPESGEAG